MPDTTETLERADQAASQLVNETLLAADAADTAANEALGTTVDLVIDTVTIGQQHALETVEAAGAAIVGGLAGVQREMADFVAERIRHDIDTQREFLHCKTLAEIQALQSRYVRTAVDHYAAEATRLVRLGSETVAKSLGRG